MLVELLRAMGLVLVIEGIIPFLYPGRWRRMVAMLSTVDDRSLRTIGLISMVAGVIFLYAIGFLG